MIKKEKGSEDLQSPGRSSAIEVKAEEYEEKPKNPPPFVFIEEDSMGHNNHYGPGAPSLKAKAIKQWTPKQVSQVTTQEPMVSSKVKKSKIKKKKRTKLKAPTGGNGTSESEENRDSASNEWTEEDLEEAYQWSKLKKFLWKDPVMKTLKARSALPTMTTDLKLLKALLNLLQEARMLAGNFKVKALFDFGFKVLKKTLVTLHGNLKAMVGEMPIEEISRSGGRSAVIKTGFTCKFPW